MSEEQRAFEALKAEMRAGNLKHLPEIREDGTIINGHNRVLAARALGWEEMPVIVREDLGEASDSTIVLEMMSDNLIRRQMTMLQQVRCLEHLHDGHEHRKAVQQRHASANNDKSDNRRDNCRAPHTAARRLPIKRGRHAQRSFAIHRRVGIE